MSSYEYNQLLKFLYFEGYADSYEEAEQLVESMTDDEFEDLCEVLVQKPWSAKKIASFNTEIARQKAQLKKTPHSSLRPEDQAALSRLSARLSGDTPPSSRSQENSSATRSARREPEPSEPQPTRRKKKKLKFEVRENFDIVVGYLFTERFADTIESAEEMAENISPEWIDEILEAKVDDRLSSDQKQTIRNRRLTPGQRLPVRGETPEDTEKRLTQNRRKNNQINRGGRGVRGSKYGDNWKGGTMGGVQFKKDFYPEKFASRLDKLRAKSAKNNIRSFREDFDIVAEYLFVEGFVDTIESAEEMAENISVQWANEIIEKFNPEDYKEYHETNHRERNQSDEWDAQEKDRQDSRGDIRDRHNRARGVKKRRGSKDT